MLPAPVNFQLKNNYENENVIYAITLNIKQLELDWIEPIKRGLLTVPSLLVKYTIAQYIFSSIFFHWFLTVFWCDITAISLVNLLFILYNIFHDGRFLRSYFLSSYVFLFFVIFLSMPAVRIVLYLVIIILRKQEQRLIH